MATIDEKQAIKPDFKEWIRRIVLTAIGIGFVVLIVMMLVRGK